MLYQALLRQHLGPCDTPLAFIQEAASMYELYKRTRFPLAPFIVVVTVAAGCHALIINDIKQDAAAYQPWLVETRRALHAQPELMYQELETSKYIRKALDKMKIQYR